MAKWAILSWQYTEVGDGVAANPSGSTQSQTAAPMTGYQLQPGANALLVPQGYSVQKMKLVPPPGSTNAKTLKSVVGDTGFSGWTSADIDIPVTSGQQFVIVSTGTEVVSAYFT